MLNKTQEEITAKWKSMDTEHPLVSIKCLAFNQEKYIAQTLDGFLMQETDFPFEIIVHDDASTDKTQDILREYQAKYPLILKPVYQKENQYSKRDGSLTRAANAPLKGKYIAECEGDDYWTDPQKLQRQADFLEQNPDYIAVGHNVRIVDDEGNPMKKDHPIYRKWFDTYTSMEDRDYTLQDFEKGVMFGQTCTRMYRNIINPMPKEIEEKYFAMDYTNGDVAMSLLCFCLGKIRCSSLVGADHRKSISNDSWTSKTFKKNMTRRDILSLIEQEKFANSFNIFPDFTDQQYRHVRRSFTIFKQSKSWKDFSIFIGNLRIIKHKIKFLKRLFKLG
ncbi:MAG: glycosyltransferase [Fibrobacteraceae bacterium]|nr:glycosyltransferase [Fibrobacteraceae bacterium]